MLHLPNTGHKMFEVAIYNKKVRALVKENKSHSFFDDYWADLQVRDVVARNETEARRLIAERFRPEDGFVVKDVTESDY